MARNLIYNLIRRKRLILQGSIILTWLVMMGFLVERSFIKPGMLKINPALVREEMKVGEDWWGVYFRGEKIGYAVTHQQPQADGLFVREKVWLQLSVMGIPQNIEQTLEYRTDQNFILDSFHFSLKSGLVEFRLTGRVDPASSGRRLLFVIHSGGKERQQEVTLKDAPQILSQSKLYFLAQGLEIGKKFRFDPSTLSTAEMIAEVESLERLVIGGEEKELYRVREEFRGIMVNSWMDRNGLIWKEESLTGLTLLRESRDVARQRNWSRGKIVDLIALTAVPVNRLIENPREASYLRAKLLSPALNELSMEGDRQLRQGNEVIIQKEKFPPPILSVRSTAEEVLQSALRSTPFIQSDDQEIIRQAETIVKGAEDDSEKVRRLAAWVYREVEKRPVVSIPSAVEVLRQKAGDCNEHAVLFTALARAVGIPANMQAGIVYQEGKFYYHAWAQVHLGTWISVDPLLNQFPADATHIRLVKGDLDQQVDIVKIIGRLKVEILEVR